MKESIFFFLYYSSATLVGILCGYLLEQYSRYLYAKKHAKAPKSTIFEKHIRECICFESEAVRSIDDVVNNLKDRNIEFHVTF